MISLLNKRMINGSPIKNVNIYPKVNKLIDLGDFKPEISFITEEYIIIGAKDVDNTYNIYIYSRITYKLLKTIPDLYNITIITEIRPGYIIFTTTGISKIDIYEINLKDLNHYEILKNYTIIYPGFIEVSDSEYNRSILIYCNNIFTLIDCNYELIWNHDNTDDMVKNIHLVSNNLLQIIKKPKKLHYMSRCSSKNKTGRVCKKKSYYKQCNIHRQENSELYCYVSDKIFYNFNSPNDSIFTETNGNIIFVLENKSEKLMCYNIHSCEKKYIDYTVPSQLMFISANIFMIINNDQIIVYNEKLIPYYTLSICDRNIYYINRYKIAYLQKDEYFNYYINIVDVKDFNNKDIAIKLSKKPTKIILNNTNIIIHYNNSVVIHGL